MDRNLRRRVGNGMLVDLVNELWGSIEKIRRSKFYFIFMSKY